MVEIVKLPSKAPPPPDKMTLACPDCHGLIWRVHTDRTIECQSCAGDFSLDDILSNLDADADL